MSTLARPGTVHLENRRWKLTDRDSIHPVKRIPLLLLLAVGALVGGCSQTGEAADSGPIRPAGGGAASTTIAPAFAGSVWVIGDSIAVGANDALSAFHPTATINAEVGRNFATGIRELVGMLDEGQAPDVLVFALGTNNGATPEQVDEVLQAAAEVDRVVFVNVVVPRGWETDTNLAFDQARVSSDKVSVVDWYSIASDDSSLMRSDGYHPNADGSALWALMISEAING